MSKPIVECIANYSEARRPEIVNAIKQSIITVPEVILLDQHSDCDHNRTVLTFVGPPRAMEEAAFQSIATAARLINLDEHTGEHPRIGATDVVPFVPISEVSMQDCIEMARRLGKRVGDELNIPVYLYEEAATRPERQNLENIRRGEYEALKAEMGLKPERTPDFGPGCVGPAGATVIGARQPLIAFNVFLTTTDILIAKKIAKAVRYSSGGLRYVKALGLLVNGLAQVSMNLVNFRGTPVARVVEVVRREAERYGASIHHCELVGLIPQEALIDAATWHLQLDSFEKKQILEVKLASAQEEHALALDRAAFLDSLASGSPTPGGGSAAAFSAATGAALVEMTARLTIGRKKYSSVQNEAQSALDNAGALRKRVTAAIDLDAAAYRAVMTALHLPQDTPEQQTFRQQSLETANLEAARVPLEVAEMSVEILDLALSMTRLGNLNAISDSATGAAMAQAALTSAGYNVRINLTSMPQSEAVKPYLDRLHQLEARAEIIGKDLRNTLAERGGIQSG